MSRVFWQFFLAIWLTIIGAIAFAALTNSYLKVLPPKGGLRETRHRVAIETLSELVKHNEVETAKRYIQALASLDEPTLVRLSPLDKATAEQISCTRKEHEFENVYATNGETCYQIRIEDKPLGFIDEYLPGLIPPISALLTSIISALLLAKYLLRDVMTLRSGLRALASGNFSVRIGGSTGRRRDEIAALGHDFDMTAVKLEELQEGQKRLFHDVSHELRSPLSRMQAAFGLLKKNPGKIKTVLPRMEREIERLDSLVEEILTLARLGSPQAGLFGRQTVDVIDLLNAIVDDATFEAQPRGITIDFRGMESFVAEVNGELIYRAIENVMRNAVKYAQEESVISVSALADEAGGLEIVISNTGPAISPCDLEKIFQPFTRLTENMENGAAPGHGLGLSITRSAIETHGGTVSAIANPDGGLTVALRLPRKG
jgi:two-component system OmpR family sensor kinase